MKFKSEDVKMGVRSGVGRCRALIPGLADRQEIFLRKPVADAFMLIQPTLGQEPEAWHPRGIALFSEIITIGVISRAHFDEEPLEKNDVAAFLKWFSRVANSFLHK